MKIDAQMRFPHPVLWTRTTDYTRGEFSVGLEVTESLDTGRLSLACTMALDEPQLLSLVDQGAALPGLFVICLETYCNELIPIGRDRRVLEIPAGRLKGRVILRPVIWCARRIDGFRSENLHEEFGTQPRVFPAGAILALGEETVINVGREKLVPVESIFTLSRSNDVPEDQIRIQMEGETIAILAPGKTFDKIHRFRGTRGGKAVLLNSVYLPAVMAVLSSLRDDSNVGEGKRWNRIFVAKAEHLGINLKTTDILEAAQKLLKSPFGRMQGAAELRYLS
ncbi:MAG: hypothetical protein ACYCVY_11660 [Acidiferrobacteraceae bacterium]